MEVKTEKGSLKTNSEIEKNYIEKPLLNVDVKIERILVDVAESEIDLLYADHVIKKEMVIGPEVFHKAVYDSSSCSKDAPVIEKPKLEKLDEKTYLEDPQKQTKVIDMEGEITVSDEDAPLHKKQRLQKQKETTEWEENTICDTEEGFAPNVDSKNNASKRLTKNFKPSNKTHTKIKVNDKNIKQVHCSCSTNDQVTSYNVFICNYCSKRFNKKRQLIHHIESHEKEHQIYLKFKECMYQTVTRDSLDRHKTVHDQSQHYVCDMCGYRFTHRGKLQIHLHSIHAGIIRKCGICDYKTNNISNLNKHLRIRSGKKNYYKKCGLTSHKKFHIGEKPFSCTVCEYSFTLKHNLLRHMEIHTGEKLFSCTVCEYRCTQKCNLTNHMRIHTGEKPFSCTMCEYRCTLKNYLTTHMKIHTGEKPFFCTVCEYRCTQKSNLTKHMKIHTGEKPFSCTVCEYICSNKSSLTMHMKIHTGEKPFSCTVCEYRCTQKCNLSNHMKIHTSEKPFSCTVCEYRSTLKSSLTKHMKIHTSEKPFSCTVCAYRCTQKSSLTRHMKIHTSEKPYT